MKKSSNSIRIGIAVAIILGTIGWLAYSGYGASKSYYVTVAELGSMGDKAYRAILRVEGFVKPGSIEQTAPMSPSFSTSLKATRPRPPPVACLT